MSDQVSPLRAAVSFIFAIAGKMPRDQKAAERIPAVATQASMLARRCRANNLAGKALHLAITTYRPSVFVDHPEFVLAVQAAQKLGAELLLADPFSFMRNLESEAAFRCMTILDALPIGITNAHDGRPWASYSTAEKQSLYFFASSATSVHGSVIKRRLRKAIKPKNQASAEAQERGRATLSRNADRRAFELKTTIERIRNEVGDAELSPTAVAKELNQLGHTTARGHAWSTTTAKRLLHRLKQMQADSPTMDQKQQ
ncbi:recombinase family protein [Bosea sp. 47.2.35]|uniref:recombinase family protein n=1 Tax=Bosea sp. 47.2.35 TaxID=2969304 RepID=UPI00214FB523|nr:recombinase family protein [Bosea sp. 47.2.35]MCR4523083.1 recombinase family protein [Bosea sp. 47.2.35]